MTEIDFFDKIMNRFHLAAELMEGNGGYDISRGMSHSVSGYTEDLFALFIAERLNNKKNKYLVDKSTSIRLKEKARPTSFKPDLSIISDHIMTHYFDVKVNLGWHRNLIDFIKEKDAFVEQIKGKYAWYTEGNDKPSIFISRDIVYHIVVIFSWNINKATMRENLEFASSLENVKLSILSHPTSTAEKVDINYADFENIFKSLNLINTEPTT